MHDIHCTVLMTHHAQLYTRTSFYAKKRFCNKKTKETNKTKNLKTKSFKFYNSLVYSDVRKKNSNTAKITVQ